MKRSTIALFCSVLIGCGPDDSASRKVVQETSPDGRAFYFMPIIEDGVTDITVSVAWPTDWIYTGTDAIAAPYIGAEAILSGGTETLRPQELLELFNDTNTGGSINAASDYIYGEVSFPIDHVEKVVPIAAEMLANPQFDPAWVARIADGFAANQREVQNQQVTQMWNAARLALLGDDPLNAFLSLPNIDAVADIDRETLQAWHAQNLTQDTAVIAVTGAIDAAGAGQVVDTLLGGLPIGPARPNVQSDADFQARTILLHMPDAEKTTIGFVGPLPPTSEGGDLIDLLAVQTLNGADGPLFDAIRTELRASYGLQAGYANFDRRNRVFFIAGEVDTEKLGDVRDVVLETYTNFRDAPDLSGLDSLKADLALGTDDNVKYVDVAARTIREFVLDGQDPTIAPTLGDSLRAITADQITARLLSAFPAADRLTVIAASPNQDAFPGACVITAIAEAANCR